MSIWKKVQSVNAAETQKIREEMVCSQLERRGIRNSSVLQIMREIPRELFIPPDKQKQAYFDGALSIGLGQTISQPYIVALMTEGLELSANNVVLEVGTGSGYQTAILSRLCRWVYTIERLETLSKAAGQRLLDLGIDNVTLLVGDGSVGFAEEALYDGIIVTAAAPQAAEVLCRQLTPGGRLVIPVGDRDQQALYQIRRGIHGFTRKQLCNCIFVPLLGKEGWEED